MAEDRSVLTRAMPPPDVVDAYGDLPDQVADIWFADRGGDRPLVLLVHGGFWRPNFDRTHLRPMAVALQAAGWDVAAVEYRRQPGFPDLTTGDLSAAIEMVSSLASGRRGEADRPVIAIGHSAGGHLVLWLATATARANLAGIIALAPVADLDLAHSLTLDDDAVAAFLGTGPGERADLDPARLPAPATPVVVVHGTDDQIVPLAVAESYAACHSSTRLVRVDGAGHFALIDPLSAAWPVVVRELERLAANLMRS
jgi:acetyl esterase/lipase